MKLTRTVLATALAAFSLGMAAAAPAQADPDTDFATELQTYGIYGPRDFNAWIGKITCKRLYTGLDADASESAAFLHLNLDRGTTEQQTYQFLSAAINYYCPGQRFVVDALAGERAPSPAASTR